VPVDFGVVVLDWGTSAAGAVVVVDSVAVVVGDGAAVVDVDFFVVVVVDFFVVVVDGFFVVLVVVELELDVVADAVVVVVADWAAVDVVVPNAAGAPAPATMTRLISAMTATIDATAHAFDADSRERRRVSMVLTALVPLAGLGSAQRPESSSYR
jgi:hypothetical protein